MLSSYRGRLINQKTGTLLDMYLGGWSIGKHGRLHSSGLVSGRPKSKQNQSQSSAWTQVGVRLVLGSNAAYVCNKILVLSTSSMIEATTLPTNSRFSVYVTCLNISKQSSRYIDISIYLFALPIIRFLLEYVELCASNQDERVHELVHHWQLWKVVCSSQFDFSLETRFATSKSL